MDAIPTRCGQPRRTRDMADIYACICGSVVADDQRVMGSNTALRCGFDGCETSWVCLPTFYFGSFLILAATDKFHLECLNFEVAPKGWRCENHARTRKRARMA